MGNGRVIAALLTVAAWVSLAHAFAGSILIYNPWGSPSLVAMDIETGQYTTLVNSGADRPCFSPDGRKVAYVNNNEICFVNNDGTGTTRSGYTYTTGGLGYNYLTWNTDAIYHNDGKGHLFRYDLTTHTATRIYNDSAIGNMANTPTLGYDQGAWVSADGMNAVMWTYRDSVPFHGANVLLQFSSDWSSYTRRFTHIWGHGWLMSRDGQDIVIISLANGRSHRAWDVYDFAKDSLLYYTAAPNVTNAGQMGTGQVGYVPNANDYVCFTSAIDTGTANMHAFMQNWKTGDYTEVNHAWIGIAANHYLLRVGGGWLGALPSLTTPQIALDKSTLNFISGGAAQTVTVTNSGAGTLTKVTTAVAPTSSWLTVTVNGSGGNTQTITNAANASGLSDGSYSATVTVSGGGATNTAPYTVLLTIGTGIAPPTGLTAGITGSAANGVQLTWTDNATNETGYSVERKKGTGSYAVVKTLAANVTTWTDTGLDTGSYSYRVRAANGANWSSYSNEAAVTIVGVPTVTITSPTAGQVVTDSILHIRWTAYQITNVEILYSNDNGDTWTNINPHGGVSVTSASWGDFAWRVPDSTIDSALIWIHQYGQTGFGAVSPYFNIQRTSSSVHPTSASVAAVVTGLRDARLTERGVLRVAYGIGLAGLNARVDVYTLDGARVASAALSSGPGMGEVSIAVPRACTAYVVRFSAGTYHGAAKMITGR